MTATNAAVPSGQPQPGELPGGYVPSAVQPPQPSFPSGVPAAAGGQFTGPGAAAAAALDPARILGVPGFTPVRLASTPRDVPVRRVVLFSVDGTDYTVPVEVPAWVGMEYLHLVAGEDGQGFASARATDFLLREVLGDGGYAAFRGAQSMSSAEFAQILTIVVRLAMGPMEAPKAS